MKRLLYILILLGTILAAIGCTSPSEPTGYTKENFAKRPPPPGYGPPVRRYGNPTVGH